jgi:hypothetical protein
MWSKAAQRSLDRLALANRRATNAFLMPPTLTWRPLALRQDNPRKGDHPFSAHSFLNDGKRFLANFIVGKYVRV